MIYSLQDFVCASNRKILTDSSILAEKSYIEIISFPTKKYKGLHFCRGSSFLLGVFVIVGGLRFRRVFSLLVSFSGSSFSILRLGWAEKPMRPYYFGHVGLRSQEDFIVISSPMCVDRAENPRKSLNLG